MRRHKLEAWVTKPFLERTLPGCLLRLSLGERANPTTGVSAPCYMLAQVRSYLFLPAPPPIAACSSGRVPASCAVVIFFVWSSASFNNNKRT